MSDSLWCHDCRHSGFLVPYYLRSLLLNSGPLSWCSSPPNHPTQRLVKFTLKTTSIVLTMRRPRKSHASHPQSRCVSSPSHAPTSVSRLMTLNLFLTVLARSPRPRCQQVWSLKAFSFRKLLDGHLSCVFWHSLTSIVSVSQLFLTDWIRAHPMIIY